MALAATTDFRTLASANANTDFAISGMTCQNCARHVTEAILGVPGVERASVDLQTQRAAVTWSTETEANIAAVQRAVKEAGYEAAPLGSEDAEATCHTEGGLHGWRLNLLLGVPITTALILGEWVFGLGMTAWFRWTAFALATAVQIFCGTKFYVGAWRQLKIRRSNMDTLVALGSTTAYAYSIWALFLGMHVYFMEAAAIITLISAGHWMESRMSARAASSLRKLLNLAPPQARRRGPDGGETTVNVSELRVGDIIVLRPGERIPIDGKVIEGESVVDESMLTGESVPIDKSAGALAYGGTMNLNGRLVIEVTAVGEETALAQIIAAVQARAEQPREYTTPGRPREQRLRADRCAAGGRHGALVGIGSRTSGALAPIPLIISLAGKSADDCARGCHCSLRRRADHCLSMRDGIGDAGRDHGRNERGGGTRHSHSRRHRVGKSRNDHHGRVRQNWNDHARQSGRRRNSSPYVGGRGRPAVHEMKLAAALARQSNHPLSQADRENISGRVFVSRLGRSARLGSASAALRWRHSHYGTARFAQMV
jgi:Cu+-exporting ATPase